MLFSLGRGKKVTVENYMICVTFVTFLLAVFCRYLAISVFLVFNVGEVLNQSELSNEKVHQENDVN
jgi:hypothetical protein